MKRVMQTDENGCVPAAISMLTGLSYTHCKTLFPNKKHWHSRGTTVVQLEGVLKRLGLVTRWRRHVGKHNAIVLVTSVETWGGNGRHVVVWDATRKRYLDPYVGRPDQRHHLPAATYRSIMDEEGVLEIMNV